MSNFSSVPSRSPLDRFSYTHTDERWKCSIKLLIICRSCGKFGYRNGSIFAFRQFVPAAHNNIIDQFETVNSSWIDLLFGKTWNWYIWERIFFFFIHSCQIFVYRRKNSLQSSSSNLFFFPHFSKERICEAVSTLYTNIYILCVCVCVYRRKLYVIHEPIKCKK